MTNPETLLAYRRDLPLATNNYNREGHNMEGTGTAQRRTVYAVLMTDVYKFSRLSADNEEAVINRVAEDLGEFRRLCQLHGGRVVTDRGDGLKMVFESPVEGLKAAVEMQEHARAKTMREGSEGVVRHRMGLHFGDVMLVENPDGEPKVTGNAVNVAARLEEECHPGQIYFSNEVYEFTKGALEVTRRYVGPLEVKNLKERIRTWSTGWEDPDLPKPRNFTPQEERLVRQTVAHARREFEYEQRQRLKAWALAAISLAVIAAAAYLFYLRIERLNEGAKGGASDVPTHESDKPVTTGSATQTVKKNSTKVDVKRKLAPIARGITVSVTQGDTVEIQLKASGQGSELSFDVEDPKHGMLSGTAPTFTYEPESGFSGTDTFTFTVSDENGYSKPATVTIIVRPGEDTPQDPLDGETNLVEDEFCVDTDMRASGFCPKKKVKKVPADRLPDYCSKHTGA